MRFSATVFWRSEMKKVIVFDQDDTINITKLPIDEEMAGLLKCLLDKFQVCIMSGTNWEVMRKNDIDPLVEIEGANFENYFIMPTTGTQFWHYVGDETCVLEGNQLLENGWKREFAHFLTENQVAKISDTLEKATRKLGYWCEHPKGEIIENRGSQVTFSALGQWAAPEEKYKWDGEMKKREEIVRLIEPEMTQLGVQVGIGGSTSIDMTLPGIDKAYGILRLMEQLDVEKKDILFLGDKLQRGGNDYPVKKLGIDTIEVRNCEDTKWILRGILGVCDVM